MHDIQWTFKIVVKTDSSTGQPSREEMNHLLVHMEAQIEMLKDDYGYDYEIEVCELESEHAYEDE